MKKLVFVLLFFSFGTLSNVWAQNGAIPKYREKVEITVPKEKFRLYLLIGQSNMAGRGIVEPQDTVGNPRILRLNRQGDWEIAKDPLHFDKATAGVGPGLAFAREMLSEDDDMVIGLIPCAAGGSSIDMWKAGMYWSQTQSYPYDDALARTKLALKHGTLTGILWHQGEADSSPAKVAVYKSKLETLVAALRREFNAPSVPFIAGELPDYRTNEELLNQVFHDAGKDIPYFAVVSAKGFTALPDGIHLDSRSQREFGKRYAEKMKDFITDDDHPAIIITTQPTANTAVMQGCITGSLSVEASVTEGATLTYQWYAKTTNSNMGGTIVSGATGASFAIPAPLWAGTYYYFCEVRATGATSVRSGVATVTVSQQPVTVVETSDAPLARAYPNPTDGTVTLQFEATGKYVVSISDMTGKILHIQTVNNQTVRMDLSNYPAAVYILTIDDGKRKNTMRIIRNYHIS